MTLAEIAERRSSTDEVSKPSSPGPTPSRPKWRRRQYIIDRRYQLRASMGIAGLSLVLLILLNASFFILGKINVETSFVERPELVSYFQQQERLQHALLIVGSVAFVVGIFYVAILRSHKIAGPAFNLCNCLKKVSEGNYSTVARLRVNDYLQELARAFNDMSTALQERIREETETLERLAAVAERIGADPAGQELAAGLRGLIEEKQRSTADGPHGRRGISLL